MKESQRKPTNGFSWEEISQEIAEKTKTYKGWLRLVDMDPAKGHPIFSNTWFLEGYCDSSNVYIINGEYVSLIDTGNDYTAIVELFEKVIKPERIKKVVLTHRHNDHTLGLLDLLNKYILKDLEVIIHRSVSTEGLKRALEESRTEGKITGVDTGDTISLSGYDFNVLYTPGHTGDSICLYHEPTKTLFSGDTVFPYDIPAPDDRLDGNMMSYVVSLRKLMTLEVEVLLPGHDLPVFRDGKKEIKSTYYSAITQLISQSQDLIDGARELMQARFHPEALIILDEVLENDPENEVILGLKGSCLADMGKCEESIACFDKILAKKPNEGALYSKGMSLLELKRHEEALKCFEEALKLNPGLEAAEIGKGMALIELGRVQEAMKLDAFRKKFAGAEKPRKS